MSDLVEWTDGELLAELRHRERQRSAARALLWVARPGRDPGLAHVASERLARELRDRQRVIYGTDNRKDLYQVKTSAVRKAAEAVVALVKASDLTPNGSSGFTLATESYQEAYDLCGSEPFASQRLGCFCSGFLVRPDVIATAGHCVKGVADLAKVRFVFGFRMLDDQTVRTSFGADDVYEGVAIVGRELTSAGPDWALVRLARPVVGRSPVALRTSGKIEDKQSLFVIGHPNGLPAKYAPGAKVRDNTPAPYFVANLDTYGGNSGSPVFNSNSHVAEGILVRGENDFVSSGTCQVSLVCPSTGCRGEDVTRATVWAGKLQKAKAPRAKGQTKARANRKQQT